ncbi:MAG: polyhydroxyalkanoate synthesis repressor PhaR [Rhodovibrionaceae bacterium]|nr:polyhydroxyalkanoate synthesis repressor PhaR [Rhodovibrionaceae bacterium]
MASSEERKSKSRSSAGGDGNEKIVIKKYANRRLYNTATSSYVTLDHLCQMVKDDVDFVVYDAKTGEDITRPVLTQIIVEEESKGANLLPINFLRQLIGFYGDSMQFMVPRYLEHMMGTFAANQERIRQSMQETMGNMFPFGNLEEVGRQNMAMMEQAMKMFAPFSGGAERPGQAEEAAKHAKQTATKEAEESLEQLQRQVEQLRGELSEMSQKAEEAAKRTASEAPGSAGGKSPKAKTSGAAKASGRKTAGRGS